MHVADSQDDCLRDGNSDSLLDHLHDAVGPTPRVETLHAAHGSHASHAESSMSPHAAQVMSQSHPTLPQLAEDLDTVTNEQFPAHLFPNTARTFNDIGSTVNEERFAAPLLSNTRCPGNAINSTTIGPIQPNLLMQPQPQPQPQPKPTQGFEAGISATKQHFRAPLLNTAGTDNGVDFAEIDAAQSNSFVDGTLQKPEVNQVPGGEHDGDKPSCHVQAPNVLPRQGDAQPTPTIESGAGEAPLLARRSESAVGANAISRLLPATPAYLHGSPTPLNPKAPLHPETSRPSQPQNAGDCICSLCGDAVFDNKSVPFRADGCTHDFVHKECKEKVDSSHEPFFCFRCARDYIDYVNAQAAAANRAPSGSPSSVPGPFTEVPSATAPSAAQAAGEASSHHGNQGNPGTTTQKFRDDKSYLRKKVAKLKADPDDIRVYRYMCQETRLGELHRKGQGKDPKQKEEYNVLRCLCELRFDELDRKGEEKTKYEKTEHEYLCDLWAKLPARSSPARSLREQEGLDAATCILILRSNNAALNSGELILLPELQEQLKERCSQLRESTAAGQESEEYAFYALMGLTDEHE